MEELILTVSREIAARLAEEAKARGLTPEAVAAEAVAAWVAEGDADLDVEEDLRRLEEPGANVSLEEAFAALRRDVAELRAKA